MKNLVFLGYKEDYEKIEIKGLSHEHNTHHIEVSKTSKRLISNLLFFSKSLQHWLYGLLLKAKIRQIPAIDAIFVTDSLKHIRAAKSISIPKVLIFRNVFDGSFLDELTNFSVYSFDKNDCKKYGFKHTYVPSPSLEIIDKLTLTNDYDITFVGQDKGRKPLLKRIESTAIEQGLSCEISIMGNGRALDYQAYLVKQLNTKAVLEISLEGQTGSTLRLIEAIYARKKVITNNINLANHPLYHPNNVLIFQDINECDMKGFIQKPFVNDEQKISQFKTVNIYNKIIADLLPS